MNDTYFRIECDDMGIYEAVERDCPRDDQRRENKPDGSWLPKVGTDFPGAISYWTKKGLKKYTQSGLKDWHSSITRGNKTFITATLKNQPLYSDEWQIICNKDDVEINRRMYFEYEGPSSVSAREIDDRPSFIRHHNTIRDWNAYAYYSGSNETFNAGASLGRDLGLKKIGIHHEILKPGKRSSWPHAHKVEEELAYILKGQAHIWINGEVFVAKPGDAVFFEPGTNLAHTIMNSSDEDLEFLVFGEQEDMDDAIYYPLHPGRNSECEKINWLWKNRPEVSMGSHTADPKLGAEIQTQQPDFIISTEKFEPQTTGRPKNADKIYYLDRNFGHFWKTKRVALHHMTLPSGFRSSLPHAESDEEEFLYVLKGQLIVWVNGTRYQLKEGDSVAFPSGTGIAHCFINESGKDAEFIVSGERTKKENLCAFPLNLEQKDICGIWWEDAPKQEFGAESPVPLGQSSRRM